MADNATPSVEVSVQSSVRKRLPIQTLRDIEEAYKTERPAVCFGKFFLECLTNRYGIFIKDDELFYEPGWKNAYMMALCYCM